MLRTPPPELGTSTIMPDPSGPSSALAIPPHAMTFGALCGEMGLRNSQLFHGQSNGKMVPWVLERHVPVLLKRQFSSACDSLRRVDVIEGRLCRA
jgi:hypothetical protein